MFKCVQQVGDICPHLFHERTGLKAVVVDGFTQRQEEFERFDFEGVGQGQKGVVFSPTAAAFYVAQKLFAKAGFFRKLALF